MEGQEIDFTGCVSLDGYTEADDFLIVPIQLGLKAGE